MQEGAVLEMRGICKYFPGVRALQDVDFTLREGEIHALTGENGAGKSTLIKVLTGVYPKDGGEVHIKGVEDAVVIRSPQDAQNAGISTVYQEITLCPNLSVAENIFIGRTKGNLTNWRAMNKRTGEILGSLGIPAAPQQQLGTCSIAVQQMVAIARAVDMECKVLILDEPTSSLDDQEVQKLFGLMRDLRAKGVGIIFVTHFLEQVYEVCDRITVLRDGQLVGEYVIEDLPRVQLVSKMLGKELDDMADIKGESGGVAISKEGAPVLEAEGLCSSAGIKPFGFSIRKGEVNGFTGLLGSGRSECVRAIFGADRVTGGTVKMEGKSVKIKKPLDAMKQGIGYLPEDRKGDGIVGDLSVRENIILAYQVMKGFFRPISRAQAEAFADNYIELLEIKTASADTPIKSLSGGNQQKCILARWLLTDPKYLILDEPTRGIDIGTKIEIQKLVLRLAEKGTSVTFISSEIDEMLRTCSRLLVMRDRKLVGELTGEDLTQAKIMATIAGGDKE
ncbi:sugar ABC transporter ATP-binding protein [uncultured Oscillibacter sp.]|uniref:sugar ABC transporter ATP-binding protein n=1 Tax=uncultured Oscillibacter sp. TaxID=876091 RepID=UPI0026255B6F|nr:sugar ABC transporter ATP-binding protein [uncultured Oscillibacter sp.]